MSKSFEEIVEIVRTRQANQGVLLNKMREIRDRYNGDYVIPLPGTDTEVALPPLAPAIIADAIDHTAMRAGSVLPNIYCPAVNMAVDLSVRKANIRRKAYGYTWHRSKWNLHARRAFRHLAAYATTALVVVPDFEHECPKIKVRDPLGTFPDPRAAEDLDQPGDVAFVYERSAAWIAKHYPGHRDLLTAARGQESDMWDLVEWVDCDHVVIGILGPQHSRGEGGVRRNNRNLPAGHWADSTHHGHYRELMRWENRTGMCPSFVLNRVSLDRIASQVSNVVGQVDLLARLTALDIRATERSIFPDMFILGSEGQTPKLVSGTWQEGVTGNINLVQDASQVGQMRQSPDPSGRQAADRLERNARVSTGLVPQFGGETYGALRTGRGIDSLMGAAVDPRVQELQEGMAVAMTHINEIVAETYKGYWPERRYVVFSGWPADQSQVDFTPSKHFETGDNVVSYPIPGADIQSTTVNLGQLYGSQAISLKTYRVLHPWVTDAEAEAGQRLVESLEESMFAALQTRASEGGIPPADMAKILQKLRNGTSLADAVVEMDEEAAKRQAEAPPPENIDPTTGLSPEMMPGLANPGEGAEMGAMPAMTGSEVATPAGLDGFRELTRALKAPQGRR